MEHTGVIAGLAVGIIAYRLVRDIVIAIVRRKRDVD